jgi:hypothetical protein
MVQEIARPIALALCMLCLCALFYHVFLMQAVDFEQGVWDSLILLSLAAGICLVSGVICRDSREPLARTLPVQMFFWSVFAMLVFFIASWYLETHCIFYKDVRRL